MQLYLWSANISSNKNRTGHAEYTARATLNLRWINY